jgi:hypothetical protein
MIYVTNIIAVLSLIVSIGLALFTIRFNNYQISNVYLANSNLIFESRRRSSELFEACIPLLAKEEMDILNEYEKTMLSYYREIYEESLEVTLTVYNNICSIYLDKKMNKKAFLNFYQKEIDDFFSSKQISKILEENRDEYLKLWIVYLQWRNK